MSVITREKAAEKNASLQAQEPESPSKQRKKTVEDALTLLANLDTTTSLRGNVRVQLAVDNLFQVAGSHGFTSEQLVHLVLIIGSTNPKLTQTIRSKLVKCLVPSHAVPQDAVVKVIYKITANVLTGPTNLHSLLLRWVLVVFDYLDGYDRLHKLYGLIFSFIDSIRLLPNACQLLFLLTRKEDVALFRVQKLLELVRMVGPEPCIMGLLMIYKVYCPHLVTIRLNYGSKAFFKNTDAAWRAAIESVISQGAEEEEEGERKKQEDACRAKKRREWARANRTSKRQKLAVPPVHAAMGEIQEEDDLPDELTADQARVPYVQIDTFTSFLQNIDNIEYPSQVSAVLQDSQLQLLMMCNPEPVVMARLSLWIQHLFAFGFKNTDVESKQHEELLKMLLCFSQNVQTVPVLEAFLSSYLPTWDGHKYAPVIFCLISQLRPSSIADDFDNILQVLLRLFYSSDVYFKVGLATSLTNLLHNWATEYLRADTVKVSDSGQSLSEQDQDQSDLSTLQELILRLIKAMDTALFLGLRMEGDHVLLQRASVDLMGKVSVLYQKYSVPIMCFPTRLFYRLLLSDCPDTLASLCGCLNSFRICITNLREVNHQPAHKTGGEALHYKLCDSVSSWAVASSAATAPSTPGHRTPQHGDKSSTADTTPAVAEQGQRKNRIGLEVFNTALLDVMAMLWQGRMFTQRKRFPSAMSADFPLPKNYEGSLNPRALTIFQGPAFLGLAYKFLREAQRSDSDKIGHPAQIEKFKDIYLQFLEREGFPQFRELVDMNLKTRKPVLQDDEESSANP